MRKKILFILLVYTVFPFSGTLYGAEEKILVLGGAAGWDMIPERSGIAELASVRPHTVLALSSTGNFDALPDLALSFDEAVPEAYRDSTGHYGVSVFPGVSASERRWARIGAGAALFTGNTVVPSSSLSGGAALIVTPQDRSALFASGSALKDFSMEFWLYPLHAANGEQILSWTATRTTRQGQSIFQRIQCTISGNKLRWNFQDFFSSPDDGRQLTLSLNAQGALVPQTWSHHLIRFDSATGMMEYLVNGRPEAIGYASSTGREGGEVYLPAVGNEGRLTLGTAYTGFMDEFRIYGSFTEASLVKYPSTGGYFVSAPINLGATNSSVLSIELSGGSLSADRNSPNAGGVVRNVFSGFNKVRFADNSALHCFIRSADTPYLWKQGGPDIDPESWTPFAPGSSLDFRGRWVQIAVQIYPSGDGEASPYVDEIRIRCLADDAPPPPAFIQAQARDAAVDLSWRPSPASDVAGYLVYYGTASGEYFGTDAILGVSPLDVGRRTAVRIDGLENGRLYFFAVAAYDEAAHIGEFSRETAARPLRMVP